METDLSTFPEVTSATGRPKGRKAGGSTGAEEMQFKPTKKTVDQWLDEVDYEALNSGNYIPGTFALNFMNFVKLVNGEEGEQNHTPVVHLAMLDRIAGRKQRIANLCARGLAKTTLFFEYLVLYIAVFGEIDGFGKIDGMIYVSDSMDNGVKSARKNIEFRYDHSEFLKEWLPYAKFTDNYLEFKSKEGNILGCKMFGAKALSLDSKLYTETGTTTMGKCQVGDYIFGPDGKLARILEKSEIFHKPMYAVHLHDGRMLKVSEDHINAVTQLRQKTCGSERGKMYFEDRNLTVSQILEYKLKKGSNYQFWIKATEPLEYLKKKLPMDPYTLGLVLGDGRVKAAGNTELIAHEDDWSVYEQHIPYQLGKTQRDNRRPSTVTRTIRGIQNETQALGINCHGNVKRVPEGYLQGSTEQRKALLQGLLDTDGTISENAYISFCSNSQGLCEDVMALVRSLGGLAMLQDPEGDHYKVGIKINCKVFRLPRKLGRQRYDRKTMARIVKIERIEDEPSQCIAIDNEERQYLTNDYTRTHNTGIRGTKIFGRRPVLAVLDDLVSDEDANSKAQMKTIKNTVHKGIDYALDPRKRKIVFNGTPFDKHDILYEAVESGAWEVNVWPVCERFPCSRKEFRGAWEDRFTYDYVKSQYEDSILQGELASFNQELMLRISSAEERLIQNEEIHWYSRTSLLKMRGKFNFYITTDFATTDREASDNSVISVWAYNANGDWFWVDGVCERQTMEKSINDLFRLVSEYRPQQVGVEVSGQQFAFVTWLQQEMMTRNIWFNFAQTNGRPGIRPVSNKLARLNIVVPWFKAGKMFFPDEMKTSKIMGQFQSELQLATINGLKGKDDCIDTVSMLAYLTPWKPSEDAPMKEEGELWEMDEDDDEEGGLGSYIV